MSSPKPTSLAQRFELAAKPLMHTLENSTRDSNLDLATPSSSFAPGIMKRKRTKQSCVTNISHVDTNETDDISNINHFPANLQLENLNDTHIVSDCDSDSKTDLIKKICVTNFSDVPLLPLELASDILSRLPIKEVIRYQCVCKAWHDEIKSPKFTKSYTVNKFDKANYYNNSYVLFCDDEIHLSLQCNWFCLDFGSCQEVKKPTPLPHIPIGYRHIVGSCNGLLCLCECDSKTKIISFCICNIATGSLHITPNLRISRYIENSLNVGFGYDSTSDDYKILCFIGDYDNFNRSWVYSLKINSWEAIKSPERDSHLEISRRFNSYMAFSNNALHWVSSWGRCITRFDLGTEKYDKMVLPPTSHLWQPFMELTDLRGCLHLTGFGWPNKQKDSYELEIWVMIEYRVRWTKLISINLHVCTFRCCKPFAVVPPLPYAYSKDGKEILIEIGENVTNFIRCELDSGKIKNFEVPGVPNKKFTVMPLNYFSLVSPSPLSNI